jgi:hypothetical protein
VSLTNVGSVAECIGTVWTDADRLPAGWGNHPHIRLCHKAIAVCTDRHIDCLMGHSKYLVVRLLLANIIDNYITFSIIIPYPLSITVYSS